MHNCCNLIVPWLIQLNAVVGHEGDGGAYGQALLPFLFENQAFLAHVAIVNRAVVA